MRFLCCLILLLTLNLTAFADGGMWLPVLISQKIGEMQNGGFKLSAEDIYSVNKACLKDAVLLFGGGCTGEIVSNQGLIFTNHHCGRSNIQRHSTLQHDYLTDGFWAKSKKEELPCDGLTVKILQQMEDVSDRFVVINDKELTAQQYSEKIKQTKNTIIEETKKKYGNNFDYSIESFYGGNMYYLFVYQTFKDIRLVGAPPSSVGDFGSDTDNWMWPRHSGDFSIFRIYVDKNNNPAEYSEKNIPYTPKKHFKISIKGADENDFTMVYGFPASTQEYLPSVAVELNQNTIRPAQVFVRQNVMDIQMAAIAQNRKTRLQYTSKLANVANAKKKWEGEILGNNQYKTIDKKISFEQKFTEKLSQNPIANSKYSDILPSYKKIYSEYGKYLRAIAYYSECIYRIDAFNNLTEVIPLNGLKATTDHHDAQKVITDLKKFYRSYFKNTDSTVERRIFEKMIKIYTDSCKEFLPTSYSNTLKNRYDNNVDNFTNYFYNTSIYCDSTKLFNLLDKLSNEYQQKTPSETKINSIKNTLFSDIAITTDYDFTNIYREQLQPQQKNYLPKLDSLNRLYQKALLEIMPEEIPYPDANHTLRITFGNVKGFSPHDGINYLSYTTLDGVIEKDNPDIYDYKVPQKLKELYSKKDYGRYAAKDGKIHVCFVASNHTTGGNSGSPVINAKGNLIGINFDRNWEGTMSDVMYNPQICRNISVDIRYVLFIIDKYAGAKNIIKELDIVE